MLNQPSNKIVSGITFIVNLIKEEDLIKEALITLAVLFFLVMVLQ